MNDIEQWRLFVARLGLNINVEPVLEFKVLAPVQAPEQPVHSVPALRSLSSECSAGVG